MITGIKVRKPGIQTLFLTFHKLFNPSRLKCEMSRSYQVIFMIPCHRFLNGGTVDVLDQVIVVGRGSVLCIVGYLTTSLLSAHQMPVAPHTHPTMTTKTYLQTLPSVPRRANFLLVEIHCLTVKFHDKCPIAKQQTPQVFSTFFSDSRISLLNIFTQFPLSIMHSPSSAFP